MTDLDGYQERLRRDSEFLCSDQRMDTDLVDRLVLQLNRIHPKILSDKEAHRFRNLIMSTEMRLAELLSHLQREGDEACQEFYRGLHIHAEDVYCSLPSRITLREMADPKRTKTVAVHQQRYVLNNNGPMFFLSCFSFAAGLAMLYYYGDAFLASAFADDKTVLRATGPLIHCSAAGLKWSKRRNDVLC